MIKKLIKECRPATLTVTVISTTLGVAAAYREGYIFRDTVWDLWRILLVTAAGLFLQSGMNLINNFFEEEFDKDKKKEKLMFFKVGMLFFVITAAIGIYLSLYSGAELFIIECIGIFSAYAYAGYPFNYKKYGLGVIMSFIMMGPLMVYASFFVFSSSFSIYPVLYSCTLGLFIPAILLGNELRDYEEDREKNIGTLTVRIGFKRGKGLYFSLITLSYMNTLMLIMFKILPPAGLIIVSTLFLVKGIRKTIKGNIRMLIAATAKLYLVFAAEFLSVLAFMR